MKKVMVAALSFSLVGAVAADAAEYVVKMKFNPDLEKVFFEPARLEVKSGDTVVWIQEDTEHDHNVVAYADGIPEGVDFFESPMLRRKGQKWAKTFTKSGTYRYHCHPHEDRNMTAVVIVDRESRAEEFRKPKPGEHIHSGGGSGHKH